MFKYLKYLNRADCFVASLPRNDVFGDFPRSAIVQIK